MNKKNCRKGISCKQTCISPIRVCKSELNGSGQQALIDFFSKRFKDYEKQRVVIYEETSRIESRLKVLDEEFMDLIMDNPKGSVAREELMEKWQVERDKISKKAEAGRSLNQKMWDNLNNIQKMQSVVWGGYKNIPEMEQKEREKEEEKLRQKYQKQIDKGLADSPNETPFGDRNKFIPPDMMKKALFDQGFTESQRDAVELLDSIVEYKGAKFKDINSDLVSGKDNETAKSLDKLLFGNEKIPVYGGRTLFRGMKGVPPKGVGETFDWEGFSSFSSSMETARSFSGGDGVIMMLTNGTKTGKEITGAGPGYFFESEVLLPRNSRFKVVDIVERGGVTIHQVEEV